MKTASQTTALWTLIFASLLSHTARAEVVLPPLDCSGTITIEAVGKMVGKVETMGPYQKIIPGFVKVQSKVKFSELSPSCHDAIATFGLKPFATPSLTFTKTLPNGSTSVAEAIGAQLLGQTLDYKLLIIPAAKGAPQVAGKLLSVQVNPQATFTAETSIGPVTVESYFPQTIIASEAHGPKPIDTLSDAEKASDAALILQEKGLVQTLMMNELDANVLYKHLMPATIAGKQAYLDLIVESMLNLDVTSEVFYFTFGSIGDKAFNDTIDAVNNTQGVLDEEKKVQLLLTFPHLMFGNEACIANEVAVMEKFLGEAAAFTTPAWTHHKFNFTMALETLVKEKFYCGGKASPKMLELAQEALTAIKK